MYFEYRNTMMYVATDILKSRQKAEDAVHNSFIKIIENLNANKIKEQSCPQMKALCVITCRNISIDINRRESVFSFVDNEFDFEMVGDQMLTDEQVIEKIDYEFIVEILQKLPQIYHDIMFLKVIENMPLKEIAKLLKLPVETVKKRLQRGRKMLIDESREKLYVCE